jgi:hypothetical protein
MYTQMLCSNPRIVPNRVICILIRVPCIAVVIPLLGHADIGWDLVYAFHKLHHETLGLMPGNVTMQ